MANQGQYSIMAPAPQDGCAAGIGFGIFTAGARRVRSTKRWFNPFKLFKPFKTFKIGNSDTYACTRDLYRLKDLLDPLRGRNNHVYRV